MPHDNSIKCRLCNNTFESILHLASCSVMHGTFITLTDLINASTSLATDTNIRLKLFGCVSNARGDTHALPRGLFSLFLILWKFIILALVEVDTDGIPYSHDRIWRLTLDRFRERAEALAHSFELKLTHARGQGRQLPSPSNYNLALTPLARISDQGELTYHPYLSHLVSSLEASKDPPPSFPPLDSSSSVIKPISFVKATAPAK